MFTKKILLNLFLTTMIGTTVGLAASWSSSSQASNSSTESMFDIKESESAGNDAEGLSLLPTLSDNQPFLFEDGSTAEIISLNKLSGGQIEVNLSQDQRSFILRDGKKMGKISVDEVKRIGGKADQFSEITPVGDRLSEQLFGKITGTSDEKDFGFVKLNSPIQRLVYLAKQKLKEVLSSDDICKNFKYTELDSEKRCEIAKYILDDHDFIKILVNLLSEIFDLYGSGLPSDIKKKHSNKILKIIHPLKFCFNGNIFFFRTLTEFRMDKYDSPIRYHFINMTRSYFDDIKISHHDNPIIFDGKKLQFPNRYFEILSVEKSDELSLDDEPYVQIRFNFFRPYVDQNTQQGTATQKMLQHFLNVDISGFSDFLSIISNSKTLRFLDTSDTV